MPRARPPTPAQPLGTPWKALPESLEPELATLVGKAPPGDWLYEIKFDGYRMLARVGGPRDVRLVTRRGNDWTHRFPALRKELIAARLPAGWYDGEIVLLDASGKPTFNGLQNAIEGGTNDAIVFYLFDAPFFDGRDLRRVAVEDRRAALQGAFQETSRLRFSQEIEADAHSILASACALGLEGVIGKRRGSIYVQRRSDDWIKLKCVQRQEFVIGGFTWPDDARPNGIGALLVGHVDQDGVLQYAGKVGTGYTGEVSAALRQRLEGLAQGKRPFAGATGHDRHATWVKPELVCEVTFNEWPAGGSLRHASFKGLREDKPAAAVTREQPIDAPAPAAILKITHGTRVIDKTTGLTKADLVRYYAAVARWALPHLRGRHVFIRRAPAGVQGATVFQEHPLGMRGLRGTDRRLWPGHEPAIAIETAEDLVAAAQAGMVELHTWNSTSAAIALPDRLMLDLDPGEGVAWEQVREAAVIVRAFLQELGLASWLKTSGGAGLHLAVPIAPEKDHRAVKALARALVEHLARTVPARFTARSGASNRVGKVFVDYLRNGPAQTTVAAFSARTRPGLGVSMTIAWEELAAIRSGDAWNIASAPAFLAGREDPWKSYWRKKQSLERALDLLGLPP